MDSPLRKDPVPTPPKPKPKRKPGPPPVFDVLRLKGAVTVDGKLDPAEWFGLDPAKGIVLQEGVHGEKVALPTRAWLAWDDEAFYVAFDNVVNKDLALGMEDTCGSNDAVELAIANAALGDKAPILLPRGFA